MDPLKNKINLTDNLKDFLVRRNIDTVNKMLEKANEYMDKISKTNDLKLKHHYSGIVSGLQFSSELLMENTKELLGEIKNVS